MICLAGLVMASQVAMSDSKSPENTNATCCATAQAAHHLTQIRWHLLRTWLGGGVGDLIFASPADIVSLQRAYRRYLSQISTCRDVGMTPRKAPRGRPYPHMWLMVSAPFGDSRVVRVWDGDAPLAQIVGPAANGAAPGTAPGTATGAAHVYLVPQVLHRRETAPRHCLVLASPGRWRLLKLRR